MGFLQEVNLGVSFAPFAALQECFGFVPSLFRCQSLLPRLIEAEAGLAGVILSRGRALSRKQKERLLLMLAAANRNAYGAAAHYQLLCLLGETEDWLDRLLSDYQRAGLPAADRALVDFVLKLGTDGASVSRADITELRAYGWTDETTLDAVLVTAWGNFQSCLSTGLGASLDFPAVAIPDAMPFVPPVHRGDPADDVPGPYINAPDLPAGQFAPFAVFQEYAGLIPNVCRAQTLRPDAISAQAEAVRLLLLTGDHLTRLQKEQILLEISTANRNTYFVSLHTTILGSQGVAPDSPLLDFALTLAAKPATFGEPDLVPLRNHGFTEVQILEAVAITAFASFLNTLQFGLGAEPDFASRPVFPPVPENVPNLLPQAPRPTDGSTTIDPDSETVARVQSGDVDAFEELINRHSRRVYRTLVGILGNQEEARDAMQDTFLKAFQHLGSFQGRSKFSTWLVSIASNAGLQLLRERKYVQSLDDDGIETEEGFRPRQIRAWNDNPEQLCSKAEMRALVEDHVMKLPAKYRVVVVLRDIEQLSIEEAATVLGVGIPALKSRHLRGRLMLREALTPHFAANAQGGNA